MKKTYFPVSLSIERFEDLDVLTTSTPADLTVKDSEYYFNGGSGFFE